jgi:hypothetical protein
VIKSLYDASHRPQAFFYRQGKYWPIGSMSCQRCMRNIAQISTWVDKDRSHADLLDSAHLCRFSNRRNIMASSKQVAANKRNALKSTGPTTVEGKQAISGNAVRHGLTALNHLMLEGEDEDEFAKLQSEVLNEVQPVGIREREIAERIAELFWRLRRTGVIESGILTYSYYENLRVQALDKVMDARRNPFGPLAAEEAERSAIADLDVASNTRDEQSTFLGRAFVEDAENGNALAKLIRYETALWNQLSKASLQLTKLQDKRVEPADVASG